MLKPLADSIVFFKEDFSGASERPIDKIQVVYIDNISHGTGPDARPVFVIEPHVLSLSNGSISGHKIEIKNGRVDFQRLNLLDAEQIIDFEAYQVKP